MVHGATSDAIVDPLIPGKIEELFEIHPWLIRADYEGVKSFAGVCVQEDLLNKHIYANGGSLVGSKHAQLWKEIQLAKREWMKILAMGPGPRSQYAQAMSGVGKNMVDIRAGLKAVHGEITHN